MTATVNRRRPCVVRRPDGALWNESVMADYLAEIDRRALAGRVRVERLSTTDPVSQAIAAELSARDGR